MLQTMSPTGTPLFRHRLYGPDLCAAYAYARHLGLNPEDSEDCALAFLLHQLACRHGLQRDLPLRRRCAHDFVYDRWRTLQRRANWETSAAAAAEDGTNIDNIVANEEACSPQHVVIQQAAWSLLYSLLTLLAPLPRQVVWRHHFEGEEVAVIAHSLGRSVGSVQQVLWRSRQRLKQLLQEAGIEAVDLLGSR